MNVRDEEDITKKLQQFIAKKKFTTKKPGQSGKGSQVSHTDNSLSYPYGDGSPLNLRLNLNVRTPEIPQLQDDSSSNAGKFVEKNLTS